MHTDIETESPYPTATGMPSPAPSPLDNLTSQPTVPGTTAAPTSPIIETATPTVILPGTVAPTAAQLGTATPTISQAGTTAPTTTAQETLAPTMSAGTTETPTVSTANTTDTTAPTVVGSFMDMVTTLPGPSTVDLLPFALLYDIDRSDIPGQDDYQAAAEVISTYLQDYFSMRYNEAAESQYLSGTFTSGDTAYSLGRGALTDFEGSATFSNTGITPTPAELDMALEEAFTGENVQVVLDLLGNLENCV